VPSAATGAAAARGEERGEESWSDEYGAHMAVPAPVVDPDGGDESGEASIDEETGDDDESGASARDPAEPARQGKKRRGRRRK
jgi:hypothetical protein